MERDQCAVGDVWIGACYVWKKSSCSSLDHTCRALFQRPATCGFCVGLGVHTSDLTYLETAAFSSLASLRWTGTSRWVWLVFHQQVLTCELKRKPLYVFMKRWGPSNNNPRNNTSCPISTSQSKTFSLLQKFSLFPLKIVCVVTKNIFGIQWGMLERNEGWEANRLRLIFAFLCMCLWLWTC